MSILIREANNAYTSPRVPECQDESEKGQVRVKAMLRGDSTAKMAGQFSKQNRARRLYLNRFSSRFESNCDLPPYPY